VLDLLFLERARSVIGQTEEVDDAVCYEGKKGPSVALVLNVRRAMTG
jgi:hypothetical protein